MSSSTHTRLDIVAVRGRDDQAPNGVDSSSCSWKQKIVWNAIHQTIQLRNHFRRPVRQKAGPERSSLRSALGVLRQRRGYPS